MTCSLLRWTAVRWWSRDSPSFDCTVMCAATSSEGRAEVSEDRQPLFHRSMRLLSAPLRGVFSEPSRRYTGPVGTPVPEPGLPFPLPRHHSFGY